jgi:hypothetical protein
MRCRAYHNDENAYFPNVIDVFSKHAHKVPIRSKTAEAITSAFRSVLARHDGRLPLGEMTERGKDFDNARFRKLLDGSGIQPRVCRNQDVNCSVLERFNRTLKAKLYRWFTHKSYPYVDVLLGYNDAVN